MTVSNPDRRVPPLEAWPQPSAQPRSTAPHADPKAPTLQLPRGACDAHCHVFGPQTVFPFAARRTYTPVDVPVERLAALHAHLGFDRAVIVQAACHGHDHAALLDALAKGAGRYRGVALITPHTSAGEVARLAAAGVCGFRVNTLPHLGAPPTRAAIDAMLDLAGPHAWHLDLHVAGDGIERHAALVRGIGAPVVIDHLARIDLSTGLDSGPVRTLMRLLDEGNTWIKLSGVDRVSMTADFADAVALARRLMQVAPARVVWGTDFPHPNVEGPAPDDGALVDLIAQIAPAPSDRQALLVDNPRRLFGFQAA